MAQRFPVNRFTEFDQFSESSEDSVASSQNTDKSFMDQLARDPNEDSSESDDDDDKMPKIDIVEKIYNISRRVLAALYASVPRHVFTLYVPYLKILQTVKGDQKIFTTNEHRLEFLSLLVHLLAQVQHIRRATAEDEPKTARYGHLTGASGGANLLSGLVQMQDIVESANPVASIVTMIKIKIPAFASSSSHNDFLSDAARVILGLVIAPVRAMEAEEMRSGSIFKKVYTANAKGEDWQKQYANNTDLLDAIGNLAAIGFVLQLEAENVSPRHRLVNISKRSARTSVVDFVHQLQFYGPAFMDHYKNISLHRDRIQSYITRVDKNRGLKEFLFIDSPDNIVRNEFGIEARIALDIFANEPGGATVMSRILEYDYLARKKRGAPDAPAQGQSNSHSSSSGRNSSSAGPARQQNSNSRSPAPQQPGRSNSKVAVRLPVIGHWFNPHMKKLVDDIKDGLVTTKEVLLDELRKEGYYNVPRRDEPILIRDFLDKLYEVNPAERRRVERETSDRQTREREAEQDVDSRRDPRDNRDSRENNRHPGRMTGQRRSR